MTWVELFVLFLVCHLVGDFLLQTSWQAAHKHDGLSADPRSRRALFAHVAVYALPFVPVFVWAVGAGFARGVGAAVVILGTHIVLDDGRLQTAYLQRVKDVPADEVESQPLAMAVDQSFHVVALLGAAFIAGT